MWTSVDKVSTSVLYCDTYTLLMTDVKRENWLWGAWKLSILISQSFCKFKSILK